MHTVIIIISLASTGALLKRSGPSTCVAAVIYRLCTALFSFSTFCMQFAGYWIRSAMNVWWLIGRSAAFVPWLLPVLFCARCSAPYGHHNEATIDSVVSRQFLWAHLGSGGLAHFMLLCYLSLCIQLPNEWMTFSRLCYLFILRFQLPKTEKFVFIQCWRLRLHYREIWMAFRYGSHKEVSVEHDSRVLPRCTQQAVSATQHNAAKQNR